MGGVKKEVRSANMRAIQSKNMKPEMSIRRLIHRMGYRYRLHRKDLPGTPDLVFPSYKKIVFVHGCFWHQHSARNCKKAHKPKSNLDYWLPKLEKNKTRDKKNKSLLKKMGWDVFVVWECQLKNSDKLSHRIKNFLDS